MLLSMTGYGAGQADADGVTVSVELRSVNNRYLKLHTRLPEGYAALEPRIEETLRTQVRRGSVQLNVDVRKASSAEDYQINRDLAAGYARQINELKEDLGMETTLSFGDLLGLPGVIQDTHAAVHNVDQDWPLIQQALVAALADLSTMRQSEGQAMAVDMQAQVADIGACADAIAARAPEVVAAYETRLQERITKLLAQHDVDAPTVDVVREVGIFAERADISEEIVRLRSHLDQFNGIMAAGEAGAGRKLEFLIQELLRETNTIGSKANDAEIARQVVHVKTCIERIREMVQNVE